MTSVEPSRRTVTHVPPGEGQAVWLVGDIYTVKLPGGTFSLSEAICRRVVGHLRTSITTRTKPS